MSNIEEIFMPKLRTLLAPEHTGKWRYVPRPGGAYRPTMFFYDKKGREIAKALFKSYEQGRKAWQGSEPDLILLDEEPPIDIWKEIVARTRTGGKIRITATPFGYGLIATLLDEIEDGNDIIQEVQAHVNDNLYIDENERNVLIREFGQEVNRIDGSIYIPEGMIFQTPLDRLLITEFKKENYQSDSEDPDVWQLWEGIDLGGTDAFACLFAMYNPAVDMLVFVDEWYQSGADIKIHSAGIRAIESNYGPVHHRKFDNNNKVAVREFWKRGIVGSEVKKGSGSVEAGILLMRGRINAGNLKIVRGKCPNLEDEYKKWRYSTRMDGKPAPKQKDHAIHGARYLTENVRPKKIQRKKKLGPRIRRRGNRSILGRMA